jgi:hypothetical protein
MFYQYYHLRESKLEILNSNDKKGQLSHEGEFLMHRIFEHV